MQTYPVSWTWKLMLMMTKRRTTTTMTMAMVSFAQWQSSLLMRSIGDAFIDNCACNNWPPPNPLPRQPLPELTEHAEMQELARSYVQRAVERNMSGPSSNELLSVVPLCAPESVCIMRLNLLVSYITFLPHLNIPDVLILGGQYCCLFDLAFQSSGFPLRVEYPLGIHP